MELGWDHVTWEENEPPDAMDNAWSALSPDQQGWATLLGYGDASWNEGAAAVAAEAAEEAAAEKPETKAEPYCGFRAIPRAQHSAAADAAAVAQLGEDVASVQISDGLGRTLSAPDTTMPAGSFKTIVTGLEDAEALSNTDNVSKQAQLPLLLPLPDLLLPVRRPCAMCVG